MKEAIGVVHGRFQVLHNGHMEYLLEGKNRCEHLVIGLTNPDITLMHPSITNPYRSEPASNPLTYFERLQIIQGALIDEGIHLGEFDIVPFPIDCPETLFNYVHKEAKYYMTIYDDWGLEKKQILQNLGCDIEVMWQRTSAEKVVSGTEVRSLIANGRSWKHLVPDFAFNYIIDNGIDARIAELL
jgi:nicotinamide-nucleotide adenylyltransferase/phosphinothricin biosynthesis protein PhpF